MKISSDSVELSHHMRKQSDVLIDLYENKNLRYLGWRWSKAPLWKRGGAPALSLGEFYSGNPRDLIPFISLQGTFQSLTDMGWIRDRNPWNKRAIRFYKLIDNCMYRLQVTWVLGVPSQKTPGFVPIRYIEIVANPDFIN